MLGKILLSFDMNPWTYLDPQKGLAFINDNEPMLSSAYKTCKTIGLIGCAISLIVLFVWYGITDSPAQAEAAKKGIFKTLAIACLIGLFAWVAGIVLGILMLI